MARRSRRTKNPWAALGKSAARSAGRVQRAVVRAVTKSVVGTAAGQTAAVRRATKRALSGIASPAPVPVSRGTGRWEEGVSGLGVLAQRRYRLFMPAGVSAARPAPLLVLLHGCGQDAASFAACTRVAAVARAQRCVVLMPEQSQRANAHRCWNWFHSAPQVAAEAGTLMAIVDHVCRSGAIRMDQIYVFGLSAGGAMAQTLALQYPDRFAAAGSHSGAAPHLARNASQAARVMRGHGGAHSAAEIQALSLYLAGRRPPPLLLLHGDADRVVAFDNAIASASLWQALAAPDAPSAAAPRGIQRGARRACTVLDWCLDGKPYVRLVRVQGLSHAWSGGASGQAYADAVGPDALRIAFAFFAQATGISGAAAPVRRLRAA
ncbi:PHB depolymerase family esterase [Cupriavidus respiraculi]|uniref:Poly(3-hydroxybutyrate) depolymerase n=1 Tax=Cupriavidus respiraculi TaxID=195930 RepID=A0ABM8WQ29_9BURK|nr:PHB depolymerase family esterase [Cupriavidus respiraculi]CAG9169538.1 hypothetical protein LMG21510_01478 [Cupriavidus respiraculi]